jgi:hypothetical protein
MPTTDYQIEQMEKQEVKEYQSLKREYSNHTCTRITDGYCDTCDKWERTNG